MDFRCKPTLGTEFHEMGGVPKVLETTLFPSLMMVGVSSGEIRSSLQAPADENTRLPEAVTTQNDEVSRFRTEQ